MTTLVFTSKTMAIAADCCAVGCGNNFKTLTTASSSVNCVRVRNGTTNVKLFCSPNSQFLTTALVAAACPDKCSQHPLVDPGFKSVVLFGPNIGLRM